ncbi:hypothetical protein EDEG_02369 [Edhazardia aedis USNM 41457]|uniref:Uncharacterized protein n=1 Tax=Edhazardia aedis (strain USNM 41457) TaxID=1003232 RepID=J9DPJ6_EDHAE|nr:hypothetical protein EDEG_02369 [Edhazardia aedis USNM 41457]|eukprot:EJW03277.1 hypothetical protein EDEG_02369 [Edhazardia aedis USNM 41457]
MVEYTIKTNTPAQNDILQIEIYETGDNETVQLLTSQIVGILKTRNTNTLFLESVPIILKCTGNTEMFKENGRTNDYEKYSSDKSTFSFNKSLLDSNSDSSSQAKNLKSINEVCFDNNLRFKSQSDLNCGINEFFDNKPTKNIKNIYTHYIFLDENVLPTYSSDNYIIVYEVLIKAYTVKKECKVFADTFIVKNTIQKFYEYTNMIIIDNHMQRTAKGNDSFQKLVYMEYFRILQSNKDKLMDVCRYSTSMNNLLDNYDRNNPNTPENTGNIDRSTSYDQEKSYKSKIEENMVFSNEDNVNFTNKKNYEQLKLKNIALTLKY